jgi:hypothetical protein
MRLLLIILSVLVFELGLTLPRQVLLLLEPLHQPFFFFFFFMGFLEIESPELLASNLDPLDLCLLSSSNYRCGTFILGQEWEKWEMKSHITFQPVGGQEVLGRG